MTREQTFARLRQLDIGHGYTANGGISSPFREGGYGMIPDLVEVLETFPDRRFLVNFKSNFADEGVALAELLNKRPALRAAVWGVYGGSAPTRAALAGVSGLRGYDRGRLMACLTRYVALGWSGYVPETCRDTLVAVPSDAAPFLWGWPHLFTRRMDEAGSRVILVGPYFGGDGFSTGIDDFAALGRVPAGLDAHIWTNRIEVLGPSGLPRP